jgi:ribose 5-phosphate isomerase B
MIFLASDHAAVNFKAEIVKHLERAGENVTDLGPFDSASCDYPDYAEKLCGEVKKNTGDLGILICGTGIGMSIAANKISGIRCALCGDCFSARQTRLHNNANVLALGERVIGIGLALDIVDAFIKTGFSFDERHIRRIDKIAGLEK